MIVTTRPMPNSSMMYFVGPVSVVSGVKIDWTPGQIEELKHRAKKRGQSVELYVKILMDRFCQDLWTL